MGSSVFQGTLDSFLIPLLKSYCVLYGKDLDKMFLNTYINFLQQYAHLFDIFVDFV